MDFKLTINDPLDIAHNNGYETVKEQQVQINHTKCENAKQIVETHNKEKFKAQWSQIIDDCSKRIYVR